MKACVFGAGAIGTHVGARLCAAHQAEISIVARGRALEAIRSNGLLLKSGGKEIHGTPHAVTDDPSSLPPQDVVLVTLKAHALPALADTFSRLVAPDGAIVFLLNGVPWWWRYGWKGAQQPLPLLDPEGTLWSALRERTLGCVVYSPNELEAPGVVLHQGGNRYVIGEPNDSSTARLRSVIDLFCRSGLPAERPGHLRTEVWRKLVTNASGNPLAALTRLSLYDISQDPDLRRVSIGLMRDTMAVAAATGSDLHSEMDVDKIAGRAEKSRGPRPSMQQDVLLGRRLEAETLLGQTQAFAREYGVDVPTIDVILPLLRGLDRGLR
jgi:2-dehydropantoate 2-reductase